MRGGVFRESYSLHLHKNLLTRDQQSFRNVFSNGNVTNQQWDIFSYNSPRILSTLRDADAVKSKMQLFYLSLQVKLEKKLKPRKKMIESEYKRFLWDCLIQSSAGRVSRMQGIKWMSRHFAENWRWHSSLDRVGMGWEFQQITELWIRVVYLRAKCQKRLSVIRKSKEELRRHHLHLCGSL